MGVLSDRAAAVATACPNPSERQLRLRTQAKARWNLSFPFPRNVPKGPERRSGTFRTVRMPHRRAASLTIKRGN